MTFNSNFALNFVFRILSWLDWILYTLVAAITKGIFEISKIDIFGETIGAFTSRIYVVLGIFMIFKLSFSLLQAVINPDALLDKERGFQKIIPRMITMLCMLIILPTVFQVARDAQQDLLPVVPAIILGQKMDSLDGNLGENAGDLIAATTFAAFMEPGETCPGETTKEATNITDIANRSLETCEGLTSYRYNYHFLISSVTAIILIVILLSITIDIAVRSIKLGVLELLAPIPIISYIDPKSQKDGAFAKWTQNCVSVYLDLFVKFIIIYLGLFLVEQLISGNTGVKLEGWTLIFTIIGVFFFMKQAPKFIKDILGIKGANNSLGFNGLLGAAGAAMAGGGLAGAASGFLSGVNAASDANAQGKEASGVYAANRARITEMRTGAKGAQGGLMERLDIVARNRMAGRFGLTKENVDAAETNMYAAQDQLYNLGNQVKDMEHAYYEKYNGELPGEMPVTESFDEYKNSLGSNFYGTDEDKLKAWKEKQADTPAARKWQEQKDAYDQLQNVRLAYHEQEKTVADAKYVYEKGKEARGTMVPKGKSYYSARHVKRDGITFSIEDGRFNPNKQKGAARDTRDNDNSGGLGPRDHDHSQ